MAYNDDEDDILDAEETDSASPDDVESDPETTDEDQSGNDIPMEDDSKPEVIQKVEPEQSEEQQLEQEVKDSELTGEVEAGKKSAKQDINDEANSLLDTIPQNKSETTTLSDIEDAPPTELDRYQNFINEYRRLQKQRQKNDLVTGLMAAGGQIGQAMAGKYSGQFTPDMSGVQAVKQMGERPVQDLEQQQIVSSRGLQLKGVMDSHDPKSPQSKLVRDYLKSRLGIDLADDVSAADAQMLIKSVGRPIQSRTQKVNGVWTNPETHETKRLSAVFDPVASVYREPSDEKGTPGRLLPGFQAESLNPFQSNIDPDTGEQRILNKSTGSISPVGKPKAHVLTQAQTPNQVYASISPEVRKELNNKVVPAFNKATEKTRQRLTHVPVILQRLQEAQTNAAALPQLKAELARFDVGDQRLAQQEFNMFGQRMGYKGVQDWLQAHSTGTIGKEFADSMEHAITNVSNDLKGELDQQAEEQAQVILSRFPEEAKGVEAGKIAPLIYGAYKPKEDKVKVRNLETNQIGLIPRKNLKKALSAKMKDGTSKYQEIP